MAKKDCSDLARAILDLAMNIAADPNVETLDDVVREIQQSFPVMPREEIINAIVDATTQEQRTIDDLDKKLTRIKNQARRESEPRRKAQLEKQISEYERRIAESDFGPKTKIEEPPQSKELERLAYKRDRLRRDVRIAVLEMKPKSVWGKLVDPFNLIRAFKTSFDLSAVLRQGGFVALGHPVQAAKAVPDMFRALISPEQSARINAEILDRENAPLYARSKLYLAPIDGSEKLSQMEEAFMSRLIEKGAKSRIPVLKQIFQAVEASERAYLTFLNRLRADSFDALTETLGHNSEVSQVEANAIATYVNEATGRGSIGIEQAAVGLNTIFFAPKYTASRFQLLLGHPMWGGTNATRKLIAREYARYLMGLATVIGMGLLAGADLEDDPRSADFGKLRFGKTRIDPLSGLSQVTVLMSRITVGLGFQFGLTEADAFKSSVTGKTRELQANDIGRFLRGKLSPTFGIPMDVVMGKNVVGEPVTPMSALLEAPVPLSFGEIYEVMAENGVPAGTAMGTLSLFGMGLQTYEDKKSRYRTTR